VRHSGLIGGILLAVVFGLALSSLAVRAHFLLVNVNIRVIHVEHQRDGLRVYIRLPMPLVVADLVGPPRADGTVDPAPYTVNRIEGGQLMHYVDVSALRRDPIGLGKLVLDRHVLIVDGRRMRGRIEAVRAYPAFEQSRFTTLQEARAALQGPPYASQLETVYAGETVVDVQVLYPTTGPVSSYAFGASRPPILQGVENLANLLFDHGDGDTKIFRAIGSLEEPLVVGDAAMAGTPREGRQSWGEVARTFVWQGILHILQGTDHVLFVLCLTIGAVGLTNLLWRVTGFTLGHTVTLIAGFFGFFPAVPWFIPVIEAAIALSIIYAGAVALLRRAGSATFVITAAIGLLHGLGFSFVLHRLLQIDSPNLWTGLLSFNLGVEIGQVALILLVWPTLQLAEQWIPRYALYGRVAVVAPAVAIAAVWTVERLALVWERAML
jgi:hypothetical protein